MWRTGDCSVGLILLCRVLTAPITSCQKDISNGATRPVAKPGRRGAGRPESPQNNEMHGCLFTDVYDELDVYPSVSDPGDV